MQSVNFDIPSCWDCPFSFEKTYLLVAVIVTCVALGIYLHRLDRPGWRIVGNFLLVFAVLELYTFNHAGRNWGVSLFGDNGEYSTPNLVSAFSLLLAIMGAGSVIYFEKKVQRRSGKTRAG